MNKMRAAVMGVFLLLGVSLCIHTSAKAEEKKVTITTSNYNGGVAIQEAFDLQKGDKPAYDSLVVEFTPGTYKITEALIVYSNTTIEATGSTIQYTRDKSDSDGRLPLISNYCEGKRGYEGAGNITINGGTWDFQGKKGQINNNMTMEAIRFMHGSKFTLTNMTLQNLYLSHYLTIEGVSDVTVTNCTFKDSQNTSAKKEAIHIDCLHNDSMAPSNQDNTIYDDSICNNVTISGCVFDSIPRGVGTHIAVAGLYPSNINISNNTFSNITYEAIKAYHYKNVTIENNTITNAGSGIKMYLYASPDESENDEEGNSNYLTALKGTVTEGVPSNLNVRICNNTIQGIKDKKVGFGIHLVGCAERIVNGAVIEGNTIVSNGSAATELSGIYVNYANTVTVANNSLDKNNDCGMLLSSSSNLTISGNTVTNSEKNGILAQSCNTVTLSGNTVKGAGAHGVYMKQTNGAVITQNTVEKDKSGGICADKSCPKVQITKNTLTSSGKNAIAVLSSAGALIQENKIQSPKNFGIYSTKSNSVLVKSNVIKDSKSTGIIIQDSTSVKVQKNTVSKAGKYGILFQKTKKSNASNNTLSATKNYSIIYSNNSKNKRLNLRFQRIVVKKGAKTVTGHTTPGLKVSVSVNDGSAKTKKVPKNGNYSVKTKKLKKGQTVTIQLKDKWGNVASKKYSVK